MVFLAITSAQATTFKAPNSVDDDPSNDVQTTEGILNRIERNDVVHLVVYDNEHVQYNFSCREGCAPLDNSPPRKYSGRRLRVDWVKRKQIVPGGGIEFYVRVVKDVELL